MCACSTLRSPGLKGKICYNVVAYRDVRSKKHFQVMRKDGRFTTDVDEARAFVDGLTAAGGDDHPEDVAGALMTVSLLKNISWIV